MMSLLNFHRMYPNILFLKGSEHSTEKLFVQLGNENKNKKKNEQTNKQKTKTKKIKNQKKKKKKIKRYNNASSCDTKIVKRAVPSPITLLNIWAVTLLCPGERGNQISFGAGPYG